jgi:hypothetical protein
MESLASRKLQKEHVSSLLLRLSHFDFSLMLTDADDSDLIIYHLSTKNRVMLSVELIEKRFVSELFPLASSWM